MWQEASKGSPCPLCEKPDWCNLSPDGNAVQCDRTDKFNPPPGWRFSKNGTDGRPIFIRIPSNDSLPRKRDSIGSSEKIILGKEEALRLRKYLESKGKTIPDNVAIAKTTYSYSPGQRIIRYDWLDSSKPKGRDKTFTQRHFDKQQNKWIPGKGDNPWPAYNESTALENVKDQNLLILEGEKNVDMAISLGFSAVTLQGSNWADKDVKDLAQKAKNAGAKGILYWADGDATGKKKAETVKAICSGLQIPVKLISNKDFISDAKETDDIEEALRDLGEEKLTSLLQETIQSDFLITKADRKRGGFFSIEELEKLYSAPRTPLIEGLADQGDVVLIAGKPGAGKSVFTTNLAISLENGIPFLGRRTTQQSVGIIQVDQHQRITIEYVKRAARGRKTPYLYQSPDGMFDLRKPEHQNHIIEEAVRHNLGTIILDSWRAAIGDSDENASTSVVPLIDFRKLLERHNISLIIVHHANKMGQSRGSNALEGAADVCFLLSRDPVNQNVRKLNCYKNRLNEMGEWDLSWDKTTGEYHATPTTGLSDSPASKEDPDQKILGWFESEAPDRPVEAKELIDALRLGKSTAYDHLKRLVNQGRLIKQGTLWGLPHSFDGTDDANGTDDTSQSSPSSPPRIPVGQETKRPTKSYLDGRLPDLELFPHYNGIPPHEYDV